MKRMVLMLVVLADDKKDDDSSCDATVDIVETNMVLRKDRHNV